MRHTDTLRLLLSTAGALAALACQATPLLLAQRPPHLSTEPAPNVIVSVDNASSLGNQGLRDLRQALKAAFAAPRLGEARIRLAWQSAHGCRGLPGPPTECQGINTLQPLAGEHRERFLAWAAQLRLAPGSPLHDLVDTAGQYLSAQAQDAHSPWAAVPGQQAEPVLACRKAYHVLLSNGAPDASSQPVARGDNPDHQAMRLPDGADYAPASDQARLYSDTWGTASASTLADLAFHYWSRDLQPDLPDKVPPRWSVAGTAENFGTASAPALLQPYWNPRNDPATWQHMVNHVIGLRQASHWTVQPNWAGEGFAGLGGLIRGEAHWPSPFCTAPDNGPGQPACHGTGTPRTRPTEEQAERRPDLWHMALNSRGRYQAAPDANGLAAALDRLIEDIVPSAPPTRVSIASNTQRLRSDGLVFVAGYDPRRWSGDVSAHRFGPNQAAPDAEPVWRASTWLDSPLLDPAKRLILSHDGRGGIAFEWSRLSSAQRDLLRGDDSLARARQRLDYLRGHRFLETQYGGPLRQRDSRLGSIVNARLWFTGRPLRLAFEHPGHADFRARMAQRPPMVFVGANDGMLHAFDAQTGAERAAYVPQAAYASLRAYTDPAYVARYTADGSPFTGDADLRGPGASQPQWRTVLASGLAGGGRGYVVLDVTDPNALSPSSVLLDRSFPGDGAAPFEGHEDVGHIYGAPVVDSAGNGRSEQITRLNNGRWALVLGNGVNSMNERPVLLIQYLDGDRRMVRLVADPQTGRSNGLAAPRLIDANGDGTADMAYAGDLQGQLWKFNLAGPSEADWGVAAWGGTGETCRAPSACTPFFVARDAATPARAQPITSAPLWMAHPLGGVQLLFGTGQHLQEIDSTLAQTQTIYSVWDKSGFDRQNGRLTILDTDPIPATMGRQSLVRQEVIQWPAETPATADMAPATHQVSTERSVAYSRGDQAVSARGWYLDLPRSRERVLQAPVYFEGQKALIASTVPADPGTGERCEAGVRQDEHWFSVLNVISGWPSATPVFALAGATRGAPKVSRVQAPSSEFIGLPGAGNRLELISLRNGPGCTAALCTDQTSLLGANGPGARVDWREMLR
ncbi:PilC/PilY family type IV pilus protein [Hydrogenophaga sp.]|uniref:pilus assembly protein n=1 Tax=Hydrogenophaga sp. TaxID=1904254 RepID=UPI00263774E5|nr:PilC/PilY family type IV pilus protein [Hydrogenophaga sp.]MCW5654095.1 hypothetical protein [Hydrogenophaga sp.]